MPRSPQSLGQNGLLPFLLFIRVHQGPLITAQRTSMREIWRCTLPLPGAAPCPSSFQMPPAARPSRREKRYKPADGAGLRIEVAPPVVRWWRIRAWRMPDCDLNRTAQDALSLLGTWPSKLHPSTASSAWPSSVQAWGLHTRADAPLTKIAPASMSRVAEAQWRKYR